MDVTTLDRPAERPTSRLSIAVLAVTVTGLLALAFANNWAVVRDLSSPGIDIQYRETAAAQTLLDQGYGPDSAYLHERVWYNPMSAWVAAALSRLSTAAVPVVVARSGPVVNLVAPAALFVLLATTVDVLAATAGVAAFIFLIGTWLPFYYSATYSPWFSPENFGQAFLYVLFVLVYRAWRPRASLAWSVGAGVALGLTFLTHTAPALIGGLVVVGVAAVEVWRGEDRVLAVKRVSIVVVTAFLVSLPFGVEILGHYRLHIVNPFPSQSPSDLLDLNELPALVRRLLTLPVLVAAVAFVARARRPDAGTRLLLVCLGVVGAFLAVHLAALALGKVGIQLPSIIPPFHFFFYLMTMVAVGFGIGIRDALCALVDRATRTRAASAAAPAGWSATAVCCVTLIWVAAEYKPYALRADFTEVRDEVAQLNRHYASDAIAWIRANTSSDDVFLSMDDASLYLITPAGRKVVATNRYFSNPYVDWAGRDRDRSVMLHQLERGDLDGFAALARRYRVRFVVLTPNPSDEWLRSAGVRRSDLPALDAATLVQLPGFSLALRTPDFVVAKYDGRD